MNKTWIITGFAFLVIAAAALWLTRDRDEQRILRQLDALTDLLNIREESSALTSMTQARQVTRFFAPDASISFQPVWPGRLTRAELSSLYLQVSGQVDRMDVSISDRRIDIAEDRQSARMRFTARGTVHRGGQRDTQHHEFSLEWVKFEGEWFIRSAEVVQAIRAPGS